MSDKSRESNGHETHVGSGSSEREDAALTLSLTLDEAHWARVRAQTRTHPIGFHGQGFERRAAVVEHIVEKFNERAVKTARKDALRAGWSKEQLASLELSGAAQGSGTARA